MPTEKEFQAAMERIQQHTENLGYDSEYLGERKLNGETVEDISIEIGGGIIYITGKESSLYFQVTHFHDYITSVSNVIEEKKIERDLGGDDTATVDDEDQNPCRYVAEKIISNVNNFNNITDELILFTSSDRVNIEVKASEEAQMSGFNANTAVFPFESNFSIRELDRAIDATVLAAQRGGAYLRLVSSIHTPRESESSQYELSVNPIFV